ncbi:hypothetical protein J7443_22895 [Tropicibacter sp. R15_0]|uniref:hypothetical protein n=1 Tax=Tropicibacter sp. R15_0 TaxID=2821101 RepID=UPI001ADD5F7D|nr:hypothetical protein [Tropicibacter sp. R15_0]MBO9468091.1 hypothetical protein [Tropicibacter sp. R15_0]
MGEIKDIKDRESLEAWLNALPQDTEEEQATARRIAMAIAFRAVARVLPVWWEHTLSDKYMRNQGSTALPALRRLHISYVAIQLQSVALKRAGINATAGHGLAGRSKASLVNNAIVIAAIASTGKATTISFACDACHEAAQAMDNKFLTDAFWKNLHLDASVLLDLYEDDAEAHNFSYRPLWQNERPMESLWFSIYSKLRETGQTERWGFWLDWYNRLLVGNAPANTSSAMVQIALIPEKVWHDEHRVLARIQEIWQIVRAKEVIDANPLGQKVGRDERSGKLYSSPIDQRDLSDLVDDLRRALRSFLSNSKKNGGNFGTVIVGAFDPHIKELRKRISASKGDARELLRAVEDSKRAFSLVAKDHGASHDVYVDRLITQLDNTADGICVAAPEVLEEIKARRAVQFHRISAHRIQLALRMSAGMAFDSQGDLKDAVSYATLCIASPDCSDEEKAAAWTFLTAALPRGAKLIHDAGEDGADGSKDPSVIDTVVGYADKANKLDKGVDAIQEAVAEGGPWVTEAYTQMMSGNFWGIGFGG